LFDSLEDVGDMTAVWLERYDRNQTARGAGKRGIVYKTFAAPQLKVRRSTVAALGRMQIRIVESKHDGSIESIAALLVAGIVSAQTTTGDVTATSGTGSTDASGTSTTLSTGQMRVAGRVAAPFATFAGSTDNAVALATALRTGKQATLTSTSTASDGTTVTTSTTLAPPTKPMGWGNVSHSLALAQFALTKAGVTQPTTADLQAALLGGDVAGADGKTVTLAGVLQQRASGMGWGKIAQSYGTTMGTVNRSLHAPATTAVTTASAGTVSTAGGTTTKSSTAGTVTAAGGTAAAGPRGLTTAAGGVSPRGLTTAGGTAAGTHGAKGLTTASDHVGAGVVNAGGNGNAFGRGIVTASGGAAVASGAALHGGRSSGVITASGAGNAAHAGNDHGNGQGRGKPGG
jgi:hypothetical protein